MCNSCTLPDLRRCFLLCAKAQAAQAQPLLSVHLRHCRPGIEDATGLREFIPSNGSVTSVTSGVNATSRIGFRAEEDFGSSALPALFQLESGGSADTGASCIARSKQLTSKEATRLL